MSRWLLLLFCIIRLSPSTRKQACSLPREREPNLHSQTQCRTKFSNSPSLRRHVATAACRCRSTASAAAGAPGAAAATTVTAAAPPRHCQRDTEGETRRLCPVQAIAGPFSPRLAWSRHLHPPPVSPPPLATLPMLALKRNL